MERYRHTQVGQWLLVVFALTIALLGVVALLVPDTQARVLTGIMAVILVGVTRVFTSLTTIVTDETFSFHFGGGVWRRHFPLADIGSVSAVRNRVWWGLGIHFTPRGWLYNVGGLDAVEVALAGGRRFRVGTDEPERLAAAIDEARRA